MTGLLLLSPAAPGDQAAGGHGQSYSHQADWRAEGETQKGGGEGGCQVSCFSSTSTSLTQVSELTSKVTDLKTELQKLQGQVEAKTAQHEREMNRVKNASQKVGTLDQISSQLTNPWSHAFCSHVSTSCLSPHPLIGSPT